MASVPKPPTTKRRKLDPAQAWARERGENLPDAEPRLHASVVPLDENRVAKPGNENDGEEELPLPFLTIAEFARRYGNARTPKTVKRHLQALHAKDEKEGKRSWLLRQPPGERNLLVEVRTFEQLHPEYRDERRRDRRDADILAFRRELNAVKARLRASEDRADKQEERLLKMAKAIADLVRRKA